MAKMDKDEALIRFTRKYFQSRQPATLEDFVWWSGLNISDCRRGIALLGDTIHMEKWKGREFYLTDDCRTRGFRKGKFLLIPPYDEYLISYKSRDIVLPLEHRHHAHNNSGIFQPVCSLLNTDIMPTTTAASSSPSSLMTEPSAVTGHHLGMTVR